MYIFVACGGKSPKQIVSNKSWLDEGTLLYIPGHITLECGCGQSLRKKLRNKTPLHRTFHDDCSNDVACSRGPGCVSVAVPATPTLLYLPLKGRVLPHHQHLLGPRDTFQGDGHLRQARGRLLRHGSCVC